MVDLEAAICSDEVAAWISHGAIEDSARGMGCGSGSEGRNFVDRSGRER